MSLGLVKEQQAFRTLNVVFARWGTTPAFNLPAGMLFAPLREIRRRVRHATCRVDTFIDRYLVILADRRLVCEAGRENDGKHGGSSPIDGTTDHEIRRATSTRPL